MMPFDAYKCYLSLKNHFTKDSYDYHKYCGKSRATIQSFYKSQTLFEENKFEDVFKCSKGHPVLLKRYLSGQVSLETMVLFDKIFAYSKNFDKKLQDPVWETVSRRIKKYNPFLNIDVFRFRKILKDIILEDQ